MGVGSVTRVDAASFGSRLYLAQLARVQERFAARLRAEVPGVAIERRYRVVLDALAVSVPAADLARVGGCRASPTSTRSRSTTR